jgi:hypothetical protein
MTAQPAKKAKDGARDISGDDQVTKKLREPARRLFKRFLDHLGPTASPESVENAFQAALAETEGRNLRIKDGLELSVALSHAVVECGGDLSVKRARSRLRTPRPHRRHAQTGRPAREQRSDPVVWTPSQLVAHDFAIPDFYVDPIVTPDGVVIVFGPREAGKTQFVFTMFRAIQEESLLLGRFPCKRTPVVLVEVDMPPLATQMRIRMAHTAFAFDDELIRIVTLRSLDIFRVSRDTTWVQEINAFQPGIIVFDSLRKIHRRDESDTGTPSAVYGQTKELFPGAAPFCLHHVRKAPHPRMQGSGSSEDLEAYRGTTAWLDDADTGLYLSFDKKKKKKQRVFQVYRARHADESVKAEITPVQIAEDSLFLEPTDPTPQMRLMDWWLKNPNASLNDAVQWLREEFPDRARQTYYNWCHDVGIEAP